MKDLRRAYLQIHSSVVLWGFTAILGKLITLAEYSLVWHRLWMTCLCLLCLGGILPGLRLLSFKKMAPLVGTGILVAVHWVCFYGSIKYANISVALSCLATTSFITALIEPVVTGKKVKLLDISTGLLVIPGVYLIFYFTKFYATGILRLNPGARVIHVPSGSAPIISECACCSIILISCLR